MAGGEIDAVFYVDSSNSANISMVVIYTVTIDGQQYTLTETLQLDEFPPWKK